MNFARIWSKGESARNSGRALRRASAATRSEGGTAALTVRSQEPKPRQTERQPQPAGDPWARGGDPSQGAGGWAQATTDEAPF